MEEEEVKPKMTRAEILAKARAARGQKKSDEEKLASTGAVEDVIKRKLWVDAYNSALISCGVNSPVKTHIAAAIADQALVDYEKKFKFK